MQRYEVRIRYFGPVIEVRTIEAMNEWEAFGWAEKVAGVHPVTVRELAVEVAHDRFFDIGSSHGHYHS